MAAWISEGVTQGEVGALERRSYWIPGAYAPPWSEKRTSFFKAIEKEGLQGGKGNNNWVVRHRHIHDPEIQQEPHEFVHAQFVGVLLNQRHHYDAALRRVLADNQGLRDKADYRAELVTATQAGRALRRSRLFVAAVRQRGGVVQ